MKIMIDIDDMAYDWLVNGFPDEDDMEMALRAIKNGIPIPDNATNGEVIDLIFPYDKTIDVDWWKSPYQKGSTNGESTE